MKLEKRLVAALFEIGEGDETDEIFEGWGVLSCREIEAWRYGAQVQLVVYNEALLTRPTKEKVRYWALDVRCTDEEGPSYEWGEWYDEVELYEVIPVPETRIVYKPIDAVAYEGIRHD